MRCCAVWLTVQVVAVARDRDVEQERKEMQRKLLDEQVQLKQKIAEEEKQQDIQVIVPHS
jgi:ethanolamine ammonia-lyase small subunit